MTDKSPCINKCILNSDGYCKGCKRSVDFHENPRNVGFRETQHSREEIIEWSEMDDDAKEYICTQLSTRNI